MPKRQRGKQRVAELLAAGAAVFAEKGYAVATMTEIAARAKAPIGSLYQFFPIEAQARNLSTAALIDGLFGVLRAHPQERAATQPLAEARMDERTRWETFRYLLRKRIASILRARSPTLAAESARDRAIVLLQLMKAASSLTDEEGLSGRSAALRELQSLATQYLEQR